MRMGGVVIAFLPLQLLWLNLMTDGLPGLSMGVEPAEPGVMQRDPHRPSDGLWAGRLGHRRAWVGTLIGVATVAVGFGYYAVDLDQWQTMMFTASAFMQVGQAFATRSSTESLRTIGLGTNRLMLAIAAGVIVLQLAAVYTPLSEFLDLDMLSPVDISICALLGVGLLAVIETVKAGRPSPSGLSLSENQSRMISPRWTRWTGDPDRDSSWSSPGKR